MKFRIVDTILLLLILSGGFMAWQSGRERNRLSAEYARLTRKTGELLVIDPSQVQLTVIPTGDPMSYAWRIYLPPKYQEIIRAGDGGYGLSSSLESKEFIARVRFREDEKGNIHVYTKFSSGSSRSTFLTPPLAGFFKRHWGKLAVEQLGATGQVSLKPDQSAILLDLKIPPELQAEAGTTISPDRIKPFLPSLYHLELGPRTSDP